MKGLFLGFVMIICFSLAIHADDFEKLFVPNGEPFILDESKELFESPGLGWIFVDKDLDIFLPDYKAKNVKRYDKTGKLIMTYGRPGNGPGEFKFPYKVIVKNDQILIKEAFAPILSLFNKYTGKFIKSVQAPLGTEGLHIDTKGQIYCSSFNERDIGLVFRFNDDYSAGTKFFKPSILKKIDVPSMTTTYLDFDEAGNIYAGFRLSYEISVFNNNFKLLRVFGESSKNWKQIEKEIDSKSMSTEKYKKMKLSYTYLYAIYILNNKYLLVVKTIKNRDLVYYLELYTLNGKKLYSDILADRWIVGRDHMSNIYVYSEKVTADDTLRSLCRYRLRDDIK